ncbi:hypothetical protein Ahy_A01g000340 [Arachis hypogaea]|uniref:Reverse transcriptase zinc-binding domain-containing protein n=1 Tax=Arachis hypogaea TaxID=3818 RepID=A0A445EJW8_ARAHY|nr:hypothetical protein Ahy_A01g000340 [Arachis hypogaea]
MVKNQNDGKISYWVSRASKKKFPKLYLISAQQAKIIANHGTKDKLIWSYLEDRSFSIKTFITSVASKALDFAKTLPPRVGMDDELINVVGADEITCVLCILENEDIDHLFIHCNYVSCLWYKALVVGGITWVKPKEVRSLFESCCEQEGVRKGRKKWINCWFTIVWKRYIVGGCMEIYCVLAKRMGNA